MNTPCIASIWRTIPAKFVTVFNIFLTGVVLAWFTPAAFAQRDMGCSPTVANPCSGGSTGGSSTGGSSSGDGGLLGKILDGIFNPGASATEQAREANDKGVQAYNKGDWATAISLFQQALQNDPNDSTYRQNLANAQTNLANQQARERAERDALERQRQNQAAANNMQQSIQNFAQTLNAAPVSGGLDFDGRTSGSAPGGGGLDFTAAIATPSPPLPSGDPMVVDARNVPSGLPKSLENSIAAAYPNAPPGVSDRVRKGFQAVMDRDWKVAKAWFEDALNRDPGNAGLKRLVELADSTPGNRQATALTAEQRRRLDMPNPDDIRFLFPGLQSDDAVAMDALFGLPPRR